MKIDSFYTPKVLADRLLSYIDGDEYQSVADFCVGDGDLLNSAVNRWPTINCYGSDISVEAIDTTRKRNGKWVLAIADFLDEKQRQQNDFFAKRQFDLILLNPPFSCIGGLVYNVEIDNQNFTASTAMKFLVTALQYLKSSGSLYAILPSSAAYSQKNRRLWEFLEHKFNLCILEEPNNRYFTGCTPNVILVSLNDFAKSSIFREIPRTNLDFRGLSVFRGKVSMNLVNVVKDGVFLVHSTNLQKNNVANLSTKVSKHLSTIKGPAVLLPRVGKPLSTKVCVITLNDHYVLSDCVLAIRTSSLEDAMRLFKYLIDNWILIEGIYSGTGAKYITVDKIKKFLNIDMTILSHRKKNAV